MLILLAAIFAIHIIGIILLLVATIDNVSPPDLAALSRHEHAGGAGPLSAQASHVSLRGHVFDVEGDRKRSSGVIETKRCL